MVKLDTESPPFFSRSGSLYVLPVARQNPGVTPDPLQHSEKLPPIYRVTIIDNDTNTYEEVIDVCIKALGISFEEAFQIALAVDHNGKAEVARAPRFDADRIASIIRTIGIEVEVAPM